MYRHNPAKATMRDFLEAVVKNEIDDEVVAFAESEIAKLDARNDKRRNTLSKEQVANEETKKQIVSVLVAPMVASEIAATLSLSTQKVSALCRQLADEGKIAVADIKVKGKGTVKQYRLAE